MYEELTKYWKEVKKYVIGFWTITIFEGLIVHAHGLVDGYSHE